MNDGKRGTPRGRDEGIYRKHPTLGHMVTCTLCGIALSASALTRGSHGRMHVRKGQATTRTEFTSDGPRAVYEPKAKGAP